MSTRAPSQRVRQTLKLQRISSGVSGSRRVMKGRMARGKPPSACLPLIKSGKAKRTLPSDATIMWSPHPMVGRIFVWNFGRGMRAVHMKLLWLLLFLMMAVVLTAYSFQKRLLRPVRSLDDGVKRLSAGHLDVVLPVLTRDEFGALTDAFNQMVRRVRQMIQARDQLLLDVSHELRSPLTRMKVALALLPDDENRTGMGTDLNEMEAMIAELLELERLRDGRGMRFEHQDLVPILRDLAKNYEPRLPGICCAG